MICFLILYDQLLQQKNETAWSTSIYKSRIEIKFQHTFKCLAVLSNDNRTSKHNASCEERPRQRTMEWKKFNIDFVQMFRKMFASYYSAGMRNIVYKVIYAAWKIESFYFSGLSISFMEKFYFHSMRCSSCITTVFEKIPWHKITHEAKLKKFFNDKILSFFKLRSRIKIFGGNRRQSGKNLNSSISFITLDNFMFINMIVTSQLWEPSQHGRIFSFSIWWLPHTFLIILNIHTTRKFPNSTWDWILHFADYIT